MGRPKRTADERFIHAPLAPPHDLAPAQRSIWLRDIAVMPPGFFVPADTAVLRLYCDVADEYARAHRALSHAKPENRIEYAREFRAVTALLVTVLRGLRMLPHARLHKATAGNLANESPLPGDELAPSQRWRSMFPTKPN